MNSLAKKLHMGGYLKDKKETNEQDNEGGEPQGKPRKEEHEFYLVTQ